MEKSEFSCKLKKIPKAELHIHLEAVISQTSMREFFRKKNGYEMSESEAKAIFDYDDLSGFISAFLKVQDLLCSVQDFDLVFEDFKNYLLANGICYCEAFFAPSAFIKKGFSFPEMMQNFQKNIEKIERETKIKIKLLADVSRTFGAQNTMNNLNLVLENKIPALIGIGLGGDEKKGPCAEFGEVFEKAKKAGLHTVAHAGETVESFSIWDALNVLHCERIGHGTSAQDDEKLIEFLRENQIPLEVCPTSNVFTKGFVKKIENHPVKKFFEHNLRVTINTDDPVFFKTELLDELWILKSCLNFKLDEIKILLQNSFRASFLSDDEKNFYLNELENAWKNEF